MIVKRLLLNIDETKTYIQNLRAGRKFRLVDQDISVITLYHAQFLKIRAVLRAIADGVKVESVEEFQGQYAHTNISTAYRHRRPDRSIALPIVAFLLELSPLERRVRGITQRSWRMKVTTGEMELSLTFAGIDSAEDGIEADANVDKTGLIPL
ncbi:hypothetical protein PILCRDRAFT_89619 [Piloderma croceum F 1598]|uniref:DNA2/NAM7 helicase-like C-terminal domain-containing protein n=1 Tax=Piloderma croceum (strain F 1598) TaxID=765440 RepID=A0A0C3BSJ2_PILCF|nr:hypothetical protein PILCRDRAFT_89619 [Piloderma croceum F 1598]